jgi:hypothetical protein
MLAHAFQRNRCPYKFPQPMQPAAIAPYNPQRSPTQKSKTQTNDTCEIEKIRPNLRASAPRLIGSADTR